MYIVVNAVLHCFSLFIIVNSTNDIANRTFSSTSSQVDEVVVTSTAPIMPTQSFTATITESYAVYHTVTVTDSYFTPSPSLTQSSDTAGSTSCSSSDTDNTPIYVAVVIVIVGLLITITVVVMGVIVCRHYQQGQEKPFSGPTNLLFADNKAQSSMAMTKSDLHGGEGLG